MAAYPSARFVGLFRSNNEIHGMKPYLLFAGADFYARGGWIDFKGNYDTLADAVNEGDKLVKEHEGWWWFHVVDFQSQKILVYVNGDYSGAIEDRSDLLSVHAIKREI